MRVRVRFSKLGKVRFTSHRDAARIWERACRRAELPVAYSEGFSPRPRLHFGLALSTGHESLAEYLDVDLADEPAGPDVDELPDRLTDALPDGFRAQAAVVIPPGTASLQEAVTSCSWRLDVVGADPAELADAAGRTLAAGEVWVERERKGARSTDDVRPAILGLNVTGPVTLADGTAATRLQADLATVGRSLRVAELVGVLHPDAEDVRVLRTHQWIHDADGARREPIPFDATPARTGPGGPAGGTP